MVAVFATGSTASATLFDIDISPAGGALNLGSSTYTVDHAIGLAALNENSQPATPATGNEVGTGITFDDVSKVLSFDFAYGSAFGFLNLGSAFSNVHIHGPGPVNFPAVNTNMSVIHPLASFHTASGTLSGQVTGNVVLLAAEEVDLFDNELYLNVHSANNAPGEIRGQLVIVPEPSGFALAAVMLTTAFLTRPRRKNGRKHNT
jgi:hypothetical protein